jgi:tetratricopeptide (TPR) repeat protein
MMLIKKGCDFFPVIHAESDMKYAVTIKSTGIFLVLFMAILCSGADAEYALKGQGQETLDYFLNLVQRNEPIETPVSGISTKNEILFCDGESEAAAANNRAAEMMLKGDFEKARDDLLKSLPHAPLFLPFQYNLGVCYYHLNDRRRSRLHLNKAQLLVPEYYLTYIQLGYLEQLEGKDDAAIIHFRNALRKNPKHLDALVLVGNIFFQRKQIEMALRYYDSVLKIDPAFSNALLGRAKVLFEKNEIYKSYNTLEMISTAGEYDKSLHYYYAETAYKLQNYQKAMEQYGKLMEFKSDRFFVTTSLRLIEHKQELAKRFVDQFQEK